jgi:hypothetical protein
LAQDSTTKPILVESRCSKNITSNTMASFPMTATAEPITTQAGLSVDLTSVSLGTGAPPVSLWPPEDCGGCYACIQECGNKCCVWGCC